jgi:hypothetical protein
MLNIKTSTRALTKLSKGTVIPNHGVTVIRLAKPGHVTTDDGLILGYGTEFKLDTDAVTYAVSEPGHAVLPQHQSFAAATETLTNVDKRPALSSAEQIVSAAVRQMRLEERTRRRNLAKQELEAKRAKDREKAEAEAAAEAEAETTPDQTNEPAEEPTTSE